MGFVIVVLLTALSGLASFAIAVRTRASGRAELLLTTGILWNAFTTLPAFCLGLLGWLTALALGLTVALLSIAALGATFVGRPARAHLAELRSSLLHAALLPRDAFREAWRDKTLVLPGLALTTLLILYTGIVSYYAPSWRGWDSLWYHEPIVGFAIQNHGFRPIGSPEYGLQKVDGYPRICEMMHLWFVIFTDRRLIDLSNSLVAPLFLLSVFLVIRRFERDTANSLGWSIAVFLMPAVLDQLQCPYIDVHAAIFLTAATCYVIREPFRLRDAGLSALSLTLAVGAKHMALAAGGILTLIALGRALQHARARTAATLLVGLAGALGILGMCAAVYLRNYVLFHSPFWPELKYDNPTLGIHWPGHFEAGIGDYRSGTSRIHMQLPLGQQIKDLLSIPYSWRRHHYGQVFSYGVGVAWLVIPLGLFSFAVAFLHAAVARLRRSAGRSMSVEDAGPLLLLGVVLAVALWTSPALWGPRYNILPVTLFAAAVAWLGARPGFARLGSVAPSIVVFCGMIMLAWAPRWLILPDELARIARHPYPEREALEALDFSPTIDFRSGSPVVRETGLSRERELTDGKVLVFGDNLGVFAAMFWNNRFSNKVVYIPDGPAFVERAEAAEATWIHAARDTKNYALLKASPRWEEIGPLNPERWGSVFRRRQ